MDFIELAKKRQSVRKYSDTPVEKDKIERCIEAARLAPSACNSQPWKFIVVDEPELKNKIAKETTSKIISINKFVPEAPVLAVVVIEGGNLTSKFGGMVQNREYTLIDIGIAAEHFCLQAAEEGLGTCILGWFNEKNIKELLNIPGNKKIGLVVAIGYPQTEDIRHKQRKDINQIICFNKYE